MQYIVQWKYHKGRDVYKGKGLKSLTFDTYICNVCILLQTK